MKRTITWLLYILMGVQIVFGCAYFVANFLIAQQFAENYVSIVPAGVSSLIQLILAAASTWYFLGKLGVLKERKKKYVRGYLCAFLLTVPYLLQMHMAKLVWSLSLSCFLWMFGLLLEITERGAAKKRISLLLGAYLLYGMICPDGLWLGGILLLSGSFFTVTGKKERKKDPDQNSVTDQEAGRRDPIENYEKISRRAGVRLSVLAAACVIFLVNSGLNSAFPAARKIYRENNLGTAVVSRFVWPNFASNYFFWDEEVKAVLSEEDAVRLCQRIDLLETEFYPAMVETYGTGKATKLCLRMGYRCLMDRSRETVLEIGKDFRDYLLLPFTIEGNLQGKGASLTAWNYGRMKVHTPVLVKYYYRYGTFELPFLLLGSLLLWWIYKSDQMSQWVKQRMEGKEAKPELKKDKNGVRIQWRLLCFTMILYTVWYTMRSNLPIDYKLVLPILFIWYLASIGGLLCQTVEN